MRQEWRLHESCSALSRELGTLEGLFALIDVAGAARDLGKISPHERVVDPSTLKMALAHLRTLRARAIDDLEGEIACLKRDVNCLPVELFG